MKFFNLNTKKGIYFTFLTLICVCLFIDRTVAQAVVDTTGGLPIPDLPPPPGEGATFEEYYDYIIMVATFGWGWIRSVFPKWKSTGIPRAATVAIGGVAIGIFLMKTGVSNVDWIGLIGSVVATQGIYDVLKAGAESLEKKSPVLGTIFKAILGRFEKKLEIRVVEETDKPVTPTSGLVSEDMDPV